MEGGTRLELRVRPRRTLIEGQFDSENWAQFRNVAQRISSEAQLRRVTLTPHRSGDLAASAANPSTSQSPIVSMIPSIATRNDSIDLRRSASECRTTLVRPARLPSFTDVWVAKTAASLALAWEHRRTFYQAAMKDLIEALALAALAHNDGAIVAPTEDGLECRLLQPFGASRLHHHGDVAGVPASEELLCRHWLLGAILTALATTSSCSKPWGFKRRFERRPLESLCSSSSSSSSPRSLQCCEMRNYRETRGSYLRFSHIAGASSLSANGSASCCVPASGALCAAARARGGEAAAFGRGSLSIRGIQRGTDRTCCYRCGDGSDRRDQVPSGVRQPVGRSPARPAAPPQPTRPNNLPGAFRVANTHRICAVGPCKN